MLAMGMCAALLIAWLAPDTSVGKFLHAVLVEAPVRWLASLTPGRIICVLALLCAVGIVIATAETDGLFVFGPWTAEAAVWMATFDVATYLDLVALVWLLSQTVRVRDILRALIARAARHAGSSIRPAVTQAHRKASTPGRRRRPARKPSRPDPDGEGGWWLGPFHPSGGAGALALGSSVSA